MIRRFFRLPISWFSVAWKFTNFYFGLCIDRNTQRFWILIGLTVYFPHIFKYCVHFFYFFYRLGLLNPFQIVPQAIQNIANASFCGKVLIIVTLFINQSFSHRFGRYSCIGERTFHSRIRLSLRFSKRFYVFPEIGKFVFCPLSSASLIIINASDSAFGFFQTFLNTLSSPSHFSLCFTSTSSKII